MNATDKDASVFGTYFREQERVAKRAETLADLAEGMSHQEVLARARARAATRSQRRLDAFFESRQGRRGV